MLKWPGLFLVSVGLALQPRLLGVGLIAILLGLAEALAPGACLPPVAVPPSRPADGRFRF
ncbi:hypothetical protein [Fontimonas thermophila]|nr:hypothetical protein [Fontimonas thermophila]